MHSSQHHFSITAMQSLILSIAVICAALFFVTLPVHAQTEDESTSNDITLDQEVSEIDFGVVDEVKAPGTFHVFKRWGRSIQETFTFDPEKKADLQLHHANIDLLEGEKAAENGDLKTSAESLERFERKLGKIDSNDTHGDAFLDKMLDFQIKQQKLLENIEDHADDAPEESRHLLQERIEHAQDWSADHAGDVLFQGGDNADGYVNRFDRVLNSQEGSDFKDLQHIEFLKRLGEHGPKGAQEGLERAEANAYDRFEEHSQRIPADERGQRFEEYVRQFDGDETRHLEIFDHLKQFDNLPQEIIEKLEEAKDIAARRFQERIESFEDKGRRARAFSGFQNIGNDDGSVDKLRAMDDLHQRIQFDDEELQQKFVQQQEASIQQFTDAFPDATADAERFRELSKKMAENPDPTTFRLIQELEAKVKSDPAKREFVERMELETKRHFAEKALDGENFLQKLESTNPDDFAIFQELQSEFSTNPENFFEPPPFGDNGPEGFGPPPGLEAFFEKAMRAQAESVTSHLERLENEEEFARFKMRFDAIPQDIIGEIQKHQQDFGKFFNEERNFKAEFEFRKQDEEQRRKFEETFGQEDARPFPPEFEDGEFEGEHRPFDPSYENDIRPFRGQDDGNESDQFFPPNFDNPGQPFPPQQEPFEKNKQADGSQPIQHGAFPPPPEGSFGDPGAQPQFVPQPNNFEFEQKFEDDKFEFKFETESENGDKQFFEQTFEDDNAFEHEESFDSSGKDSFNQEQNDEQKSFDGGQPPQQQPDNVVPQPPPQQDEPNPESFDGPKNEGNSEPDPSDPPPSGEIQQLTLSNTFIQFLNGMTGGFTFIEKIFAAPLHLLSIE